MTQISQNSRLAQAIASLALGDQDHMPSAVVDAADYMAARAVEQIGNTIGYNVVIVALPQRVFANADDVVHTHVRNLVGSALIVLDCGSYNADYPEHAKIIMGMCKVAQNRWSAGGDTSLLVITRPNCKLVPALIEAALENKG